MMVSITGANGFIGGTLARRYRAEGHEVVGVDTSGDGSAGVVAGDITTEGDWSDTMIGCDLVIHTAAVVANNVAYEQTWKVNVLGTRRVIEAAARGGAARLVHFLGSRLLGPRLPRHGRRDLARAPRRAPLRRHQGRKRTGRPAGPCRGPSSRR